jgi:hypothetical protein
VVYLDPSRTASDRYFCHQCQRNQHGVFVYDALVCPFDGKAHGRAHTVDAQLIEQCDFCCSSFYAIGEGSSGSEA